MKVNRFIVVTLIMSAFLCIAVPLCYQTYSAYKTSVFPKLWQGLNFLRGNHPAVWSIALASLSFTTFFYPLFFDRVPLDRFSKAESKFKARLKQVGQKTIRRRRKIMPRFPRAYRRYTVYQMGMGYISAVALIALGFINIAPSQSMIWAAKVLVLAPTLTIECFALLFGLCILGIMAIGDLNPAHRKSITTSVIAQEFAIMLRQIYQPNSPVKDGYTYRFLARRLDQAGWMIDAYISVCVTSLSKRHQLRQALLPTLLTISNLANEMRCPKSDSIDRARIVAEHFFYVFSKGLLGTDQPQWIRNLGLGIDPTDQPRFWSFKRKFFLGACMLLYAIFPLFVIWASAYFLAITSIPAIAQSLLGTFYLFWLGVGVILFADHVDERLKAQFRDTLRSLLPGA